MHPARHRAIRAPDDGRTDWFAGGAERATRASSSVALVPGIEGGPDMLPRRALPGGRLATLGATRTSATGCYPRPASHSRHRQPWTQHLDPDVPEPGRRARSRLEGDQVLGAKGACDLAIDAVQVVDRVGDLVLAAGPVGKRP